MRQFDNRDALRPEEENQRNDPQPDRDAAVGGNRRHHVEVENGNHEQQNEITPAEHALQMRLRILPSHRCAPVCRDLAAQCVHLIG